jgi:threonine/homoserine/homoserine lactone efflux protein
MILHFFQGAALALSATIMPGPFQAFLLSKSLQNGWRKTLPAAFAPVITDGPIIGLVLLILTRFPTLILYVFHIAGGLFILYIAKGIFQSLKLEDMAPEPSEAAARKSLFQAMVMNALNPNPYIFWSVVGGPIILSAWREAAGVAIGFLVGFFGTFVVGLSVLIILFATAGKLNPNANRILRLIAAVSLLGFGVYQIYHGVRPFIPHFLS